MRLCFVPYRVWQEDKMAKDLLSSRTTPDRSKINLANQAETKFWARELGISREQLAQLIDKVGNSAAAVRKELATTKAGAP